MTQISKRYIPEEKLNRIFSLLFDLILSISDKKEAEDILSELLTPTERIMVAKRVACFYMLLKNVPNNQIADVIKLSTATVTYFKHYLENSRYISEYFSDKLVSEKIKNFLQDLLVEYLYNLPRKGSNWGENKKTYWKYKKVCQEGLLK